MAKFNEQYVIDKGKIIIARPTTKYGVDHFELVLINEYGTETTLCTTMSKEMIITKLDQLLNKRFNTETLDEEEV